MISHPKNAEGRIDIMAVSEAGVHVIEMKPGTGKSASALSVIMRLHGDKFQVLNLPRLSRFYQSEERNSRDIPRFLSRLGLIAGLFIRPDGVDDFIEILEAKYKKRYVKRGKFWATLYGLRDIGHSLWPLAAWLLHRLLALEVIRHLFN